MSTSTEAVRARRVPWPVAFWRSQVGKKAVMAVSGIVLLGYVFAHMAGNLKMFLGATALNEYAEWLRELGEPAAPRTSVLWLLRSVLLVSTVAHIVAAAQLTIQNRRARPQRYAKGSDYVAATFASRTLRWGGVIIALFVVYHLMHLTWGTAHPDFVRGDVFHNVVAGFSNPAIVAVYVVANLALGLHIKHGVWSLFRSLGFANPRFEAARVLGARMFAAVIVVGNVAMPIAVFAGIVR